MAAAQTVQTKVSLKGLVKYFGRFYSITVDDISNPTCERTMDILWSVCCYIYGEDYLLCIMKGKEKRVCMTAPLLKLFQRLLPKAMFTMKDLIFPTKERMVIIFGALMKFLKVWDTQVHIRDSINEEIQVAQARQQELDDAILDAAKSVHAAKGKRDQSMELYKTLQDKFLTLETVKSQTQAKVSARECQVEEVKKTTLELKTREAELRAGIKASEERIGYLQENTLPPKAEIDQKMYSLNEEIAQLQEQLQQKQRINNDWIHKLETSDKDKTSLTTAISSLTETLRLRDKNREETAECEEAIHRMEKPYRELQVEISECKLERDRCSQAIKAETASLKQRLENVELDTVHRTTVRDTKLTEVNELKPVLNELSVKLEDSITAMEASKAAYKKVLAAEEAGRKHLNMLRNHLRSTYAKEEEKQNIAVG